MGSRTAKPYRTTNLVVFAAKSSHDYCGDHSFVAHGDALILDPGCRSELHKEVWCVKSINLSCEFDGLLQNHACMQCISKQYIIYVRIMSQSTISICNLAGFTSVEFNNFTSSKFQ